MNVIYPVILSGGSGTRLWPLSRAMYPKQFIRFFNDQASSFLAATLKRLPAAAGFAPPIDRLQQRSPLPGRGRGRACRRNAACDRARAGRRATPRRRSPSRPCIVAREDPAGILVVMPSDHVIKDEPGFVAAVRRAAEVARRASSCCSASRRRAAHRLRLHPARRAAAGFADAFAVEAFAEKPDRRRPPATSTPATTPGTAASSCFGARTFLDELARLEPAILDAAQAGARRRQGGPGLPAPRHAGVRAGARHLRRLRRDGADRPRRRAAGRHRLERRRLLVVAVGARRTRDAARQRRAGRRAAGGHDQLLHPFRAGAGRHHRRRRTSSSSTRPTRCSLPTASRAQDVSGIVARLKQAKPQGARAAPAQLSAVGLLRDAEPRPALPG